jgi:hypothetical protein
LDDLGCCSEHIGSGRVSSSGYAICNDELWGDPIRGSGTCGVFRGEVLQNNIILAYGSSSLSSDFPTALVLVSIPALQCIAVLSMLLLRFFKLYIDTTPCQFQVLSFFNTSSHFSRTTNNPKHLPQCRSQSTSPPSSPPSPWLRRINATPSRPCTAVRHPPSFSLSAHVRRHTQGLRQRQGQGD